MASTHYTLSSLNRNITLNIAGEIELKYLFLAGKRIDSIPCLRAYFSESCEKDILYSDLKRKYIDGSLERWIKDKDTNSDFSSLSDDSLHVLCSYKPDTEPDPLLKESDPLIRAKIRKLETMTWFNMYDFNTEHDWCATATSNDELEQIFDFIRESVSEYNTSEQYPVYICNVNETFEIDFHKIGGIHFIGHGKPTLKIICGYREDFDLNLLNISFSEVKILSTNPCNIITSTYKKSFTGCELSEAIESNFRREKK